MRRPQNVALLALLLAALALAGCDDDSAGDTAASSLPDLGLDRAEETRDCLINAGFQVNGGRPSPGDRDAPDVELIVSAGLEEGAFIAYYPSEAEAERREAQVARNAARFNGSVKRSGSVTLIYYGEPNPGDRAIIEGCAL